MIKISVIGKSGNAARHINLINELKNVDLYKVLYHKKCSKSNLPITNEIDEIKNSDGIIISSPTDTHFPYLKHLINFRGLILLEKPGASSSKEVEEMLKWDKSVKEKIIINYNFKHSKLVKIISRIVTENNLGKCLNVNILTGHGLASKSSYKKNWRNSIERSLGVAELVGSHYVNLVQSLFGDFKKSSYFFSWNEVKKNGHAPDHVNLNFLHQNGTISNLIHSYCSPFQTRILLTFTNGLITYDGKSLNVFHPRDSFDKDKRFISPPLIDSFDTTIEENWKNSFKDSLKNFFNLIKNNKSLKKEHFENDLVSIKEILKIKNQLRFNCATR